MRKGFDGLYGLVRDHLGQDPQSGHLFLFTNRGAQGSGREGVGDNLQRGGLGMQQRGASEEAGNCKDSGGVPCGHYLL
jgi:hypothetical protein